MHILILLSATTRDLDFSDLIKYPKYNIKETMPTDISGSRAASGGHSPYNRPSAQSLWDNNKFGNKKKE